MFTVHDYKQVGMPALGTLPRAENAWALADALGIREHARMGEGTTPLTIIDPSDARYRTVIAPMGV